MLNLPPDPATGEAVLPWARAVNAALRRLRLTSGPGIRITESANSTAISADSKSPPATQTGHPFQVLTRKEDSGYQAKVVLESSLFQSLRPNHKYPINGLDTWFPLIANDAIWLGITFDGSGNVTWAGIDSWGQGDDFDITQDAWSGENGYCEDDGSSGEELIPPHQTSRKLIAYSVAGDSGEPVLTQVMFHDQVLRDCLIDGRAARYPFDHEGGYPL